MPTNIVGLSRGAVSLMAHAMAKIASEAKNPAVSEEARKAAAVLGGTWSGTYEEHGNRALLSTLVINSMSTGAEVSEGVYPEAHFSAADVQVAVAGLLDTEGVAAGVRSALLDAATMAERHALPFAIVVHPSADSLASGPGLVEHCRREAIRRAREADGGPSVGGAVAARARLSFYQRRRLLRRVRDARCALG